MVVDYLQNADILREYIARLSLLGWTTRQEFEEIWMCLLQVLTISKDDLTDDEVIALSQSSTLIIHGITQLLLHTMKMPNSGQTIHSLPIHSPRSVRCTFYDTERGKQLKTVEDSIQQRLSCKENGGLIILSSVCVIDENYDTASSPEEKTEIDIVISNVQIVKIVKHAVTFRLV